MLLHFVADTMVRLIKTLVALYLLSAASAEDPDSLKDVGKHTGASDWTTETIDKKYVPCTTQKGETGECARYFQCQFEDSDTQEGCASAVDVCCTPSQRIQPRSPPKPKPQECGWRNPEGIEIVGLHDSSGGIDIAGQPRRYSIDYSSANFAEIPWMCAILKVDSEKLVYIAAGSLIHPNVVLTAALPVSTPQKLRVRCGEWDSVSDIEPYVSIDRDVDSVEVHPDFHKGRLFNDIALLFLAQSMPSAPHIGVACLPAPQTGVREGIECLGVGWGKDTFGKEGRYSNELQKMKLSTVNRSMCVETLQKTRLGPSFQLHESFTCAMVDQEGCVGDQGSPLSCPIEGQADRYVVHGAHAWSWNCSQPAMFVSTAVFRTWVDDHIVKRGYNTTVY